MARYVFGLLGALALLASRRLPPSSERASWCRGHSTARPFGGIARTSWSIAGDATDGIENTTSSASRAGRGGRRPHALRTAPSDPRSGCSSGALPGAGVRVHSLAVTPNRPLLLVAASGFVVGAAFHGAAIARGGPDPGSSPARHAAFVAINLLCAAGFVWRPRGFTALFAALTAQQLASHGALAWRLWRDARRLDAPSLVVLVAMPALLAMLLRDRAPTAPASP